jgi:hypothetical protein
VHDGDIAFMPQLNNLLLFLLKINSRMGRRFDGTQCYIYTNVFDCSPGCRVISNALLLESNTLSHKTQLGKRKHIIMLGKSIYKL